MSTLPPPRKTRASQVRVTKRSGMKEILVFGQRDPRGPDNNIYIWVDEQDRLHIQVLKAQRCYKFAEMKDGPGSVEIIAV